VGVSGQEVCAVVRPLWRDAAMAGHRNRCRHHRRRGGPMIAKARASFSVTRRCLHRRDDDGYRFGCKPTLFSRSGRAGRDLKAHGAVLPGVRGRRASPWASPRRRSGRSALAGGRRFARVICRRLFALMSTIAAPAHGPRWLELPAQQVLFRANGARPSTTSCGKWRTRHSPR